MLPPAVDTLIDLALEEDLGRGDATSEALLDRSAVAGAKIIAKERLVVSGLDVAARVFERVDRLLELELLARAGETILPDQPVLVVHGCAQAILGAERTALNFLSRLSGIATLTQTFVATIAGTRARLCDTRKTTPGWRWLEKRAVRDGGGANHRADLASGILIKDNHVAIHGVKEAIARARTRAPHGLRIEIEVGSVAELEQAITAGADLVLLDNMPLPAIAEAVRVTAGRVPLEVSGGVSLGSIRAIAELGVDLISVGRLTHGALGVDLSLELTHG